MTGKTTAFLASGSASEEEGVEQKEGGSSAGSPGEIKEYSTVIIVRNTDTMFHTLSILLLMPE